MLCKASCKRARTSCKRELRDECKTSCKKGALKSKPCKECKKKECKNGFKTRACTKAHLCKKPKAL